jgi:NAD dependent epimerase/dehydratase family enzyme
MLFGEMAGIILQGRRIIPARLLEAGFPFKHPTLSGALQAILG